MAQRTHRGLNPNDRSGRNDQKATDYGLPNGPLPTTCPTCGRAIAGVSATGPGRHSIEPCGHTLPRLVTDGGREPLEADWPSADAVARIGGTVEARPDGGEDAAELGDDCSNCGHTIADLDLDTGLCADCGVPITPAGDERFVTDGGQATADQDHEREWYCKQCGRATTDPWTDQTCPECDHDHWTSHPQLVTDGGLPAWATTLSRLDGGEDIRCTTCGATNDSVAAVEHHEECPYSNDPRTDGGTVDHGTGAIDPTQKRCPKCGRVMHKNRWPQHVGDCDGGEDA